MICLRHWLAIQWQAPWRRREEDGGIYMYMWQVGKPNNYDKINTELKQYVQNHQSIWHFTF